MDIRYIMLWKIVKVPDLKLPDAGHMQRRPFAQVYKGLGEEKAAGTAAAEALIQIQNIYHTDNGLLKLPPSERKKRRKTLVKPLVDTFFEWCRKSIDRVPPSSETADGIKYCINQEKYLRVFLDDPQIPLDNNLAEQAIRPFCVGKKNWKLIDTVHGAQGQCHYIQHRRNSEGT